METIIIKEKEKGILSLNWKEYQYATNYLLFGLTPLHNYEIIKRTKKNQTTIKKEVIQRYREIKIKYIIEEKNKDRIISSLYSKKEDIEEIKTDYLHSYQNYTISFQNKSFYDKYYIYEKQNNIFHLIIETEDFQINSPLLKENHTYYIEGLINDYVKGQSKEFTIHKKEKQTKKTIPLSIIIPIYNAQLFLSRCIDSILLSSVQPQEIILINDESTDQSKKIINWYQNNYQSIIKTYYQKNQGVSIARNKGIDLATKKYLAFLDQDDMIHPNMYEKLYTTIKKENADIAIGKVVIRKDKNQKQFCLNLTSNKIYSYEKMIEEKNKKTPNNIFFTAIWNKIIKTSLIKDHPFIKQNYYEDTFFTRMIYSYIKTFYYVKDAIYIWDCRFQKTIGTATNQYYLKENQDQLFYHRCYMNAMINSIEKGNQEKKEFLIYDSLKEIIDFIKILKKEKDIQNILKFYKEKINTLNNKYSLYNNPYIKEDRQLLKELKELQ